MKPGLGLILLIVALFNFSFDGVNSVTGVFIKNKFGLRPDPGPVDGQRWNCDRFCAGHHDGPFSKTLR